MDQLAIALRPWTYDEIAVLWSGLLLFAAATLVLHGRGHARAAHLTAAAAGAVVTARLWIELATHYATCPGCSFWFDLCPNPASWAFLYDYLVCCVVLGTIAARELGRYGERAAPWIAAACVSPVVAAPLLFARLHDLEATGTPRPQAPRAWPYAALAVLAAPFVMPALPFDHFGALGAEFFWDSTSNPVNAYVGDSVMLLFAQVFLFTLPRTRSWLWQVAGLFLAFNCLASYIALWFLVYDRAGGRVPVDLGVRRSLAHVAALLTGNLVAAGFGVTLRVTAFVIKAPAQACAEGLATRDRELPACLADLEARLPAREAGAATGGGWAQRLPDETRAAIAVARDAIAAPEAERRQLVTRLARLHGAKTPSCEEAASANYAVVYECAAVTTGTTSP